MTKKIFFSILTISGIVVLTAFILIIWVMYSVSSSKAESDLKTEGGIIASAVEMNGGRYLDNTSFRDLRVTWISAGGRVIFDSQQDPRHMDDHSDRIEVAQAFESGEGSSSRYSSTAMETTINYARKISDGSVIRVSSIHDSLTAVILKQIYTYIFYLAAIALLSAILASVTARAVVKPINDIDLDSPDISKNYSELAPLLKRLKKQNNKVSRQMDELRQNREQFSLITDSMSEGLILADSKGLILSGNSSAFRLLNAEKNGDRQSIFTLDHTDAFRRCIINAMGGKGDQCVINSPGGHRQIIASPASSTGMVNGIVVLVLDVTEREKLDRMRREFTSNVSHELKTPLTTIYGIADMLACGIVKPEDAAGFGENIRSEADRLITLINDIVALSKLDEDSVPRQDEDVDLYDMALEITERLRPEAENRNVSYNVSGEHTVIHGNRTILDEVIANLCSNAIKYNHTGGSYEVKISHIPTKALITVSDTGIGIPPEHIDRIFERFYRVDKSRSRKIKGTGLGLSIVKHGVLYHSGDIRVESTPDIGTTFVVEIPCAAKPKK